MGLTRAHAFSFFLIFQLVSSSLSENEIQTAQPDLSFSNILNFGWNQFALLDDTQLKPNPSSLGCHSKELTLPADWALASSTDLDHRAAMMFGNWGTSCIVFGDGVSLTPKGELCGTGQLVQGSKKNTYKVKSCDQKILIVKSEPDHPLQDFSGPNVSVLGSEAGTSSLKLTPTATSEAVAHMVWHVVSYQNHVGWEGFSLVFECQGDKARLNVSVQIVYQQSRTSLHTKDFTCESKQSTRFFDIYAQTKAMITKEHIKEYEIYFSSKDEVKITNIQARPLPDNLLENPSFDSASPSYIPGWSSVSTSNGGISFMPSIERHSEGSCSEFSGGKKCPWSSILLFNRFHNFDHGVFQEIPLEDKHFNQAIYIGGWSKALEVSGTPDHNYGIWVEVTYAETKKVENVLVLPFSTGTHDWEYRDGVVHVESPIKSLKIIALFRNHVGTVFFDDLIVKMGLPVTKPFACQAAAFGDPHIITFNKEYYPFGSIGEFVMMSIKDVEIQSRHENISPLASGITAIAVKFENQTFSIVTSTGNNDPKLYVNREPWKTPLSETDFIPLPSIGSITVRGSLKNSESLYIDIRYLEKIEIEVDIYGTTDNKRQLLQIRVSIPQTDGVEGILGSCDNPNIYPKNGELQFIVANFTTYNESLWDEYATSWLVSGENSLFNYETGENPEIYRSTHPVTPAAPTSQISTSETQKFAKPLCRTQHLPENGDIFRACMSDVVFKNLTSTDYHKFMFLIKGGSPPFEGSTLDPILNQHFFETPDKQFYKMMIIGLVVVFVFVGIAAFFIVLMSKVRKRRRNYQMVAVETEGGGEVPTVGKST